MWEGWTEDTVENGGSYAIEPSPQGGWQERNREELIGQESIVAHTVAPFQRTAEMDGTRSLHPLDHDNLVDASE